MSRQREREGFLAQLHAAGVSMDDGRKFLRYGTTLRRLAEAQCNGDWPADNGERKVVPCGGETAEVEDVGCGLLWAPSVLKGPSRQCPDCRTEALVRKLAQSYGLGVELQGDPRGAVLKLMLSNGREACW